MMRDNEDRIRKTNSKESLSPLSDSFTFPFVSKKAKPVSELTFFERDKQKKEEDTTGHAPTKAYKHGNLHYVKSDFDPNKEYTYEELVDIAGSVYLEVGSAALCQLYHPDLVPPSTRAYYDDKWRFSVASKNFPGFVTMRDQNLTEDDFFIESIDNSTESQQKAFSELKSLGKKLVTHLEILPIENPKSYMDSFFNGFHSLKNTVNRHRYIPAGIQVKEALDEFLKKPDLTSEKLFDLLVLLKKRKNHIQKAAIEEEKRKNELSLLEPCILCVTRLHAQSEQNKINHVDIKQYEKMDKILRDKGIELDGCDFFVIPLDSPLSLDELNSIPHSRCAFILRGRGFLYVDKGVTKEEPDIAQPKGPPKGEIEPLPDDMVNKLIKELELDHPGLACRQGRTRPMIEKLSPAQLKKIAEIIPGYDHFAKQAALENQLLTEIIDGKPFTISVKEMLKYRRVRNLSDVLYMMIEERNVDGHILNFGTNGVVDTGQYNWNEKYRYVKTYTGGLQKIPDFKRTVTDKRQFPNVVDIIGEFRYLPVKAINAISSYAVSGAQQVSSFFAEKTKNFPNGNESDICKKLTISPVNEYHKFKNDLIKLLTPNKTLEAIFSIEMHKDIPLKKDPRLPKEGLKKIAEVISARKISEKAEIKSVNYEMQEFRDFMKENGSYVYSRIVENFKTYQNKLIQKMSCDLVSLTEPPVPENCKNIPGKSRFAYALSGDQLFYIDKKKNSVQQIAIEKINAEKLKGFFGIQTDQSICCQETLTFEQYKFIYHLTKHVHKKLFYYPLINSFDFEKIEQEYNSICKAARMPVAAQNSKSFKLDQLNNSTLETLCTTPVAPSPIRGWRP